MSISDSFGSNKGLYLQWLDSMWIERVLNYMIQYNIPAIPIHDSVVCPEECAEDVQRYMHLAYKQSFPLPQNLKLKVKKGE